MFKMRFKKWCPTFCFSGEGLSSLPSLEYKLGGWGGESLFVFTADSWLLELYMTGEER